MRIFSRPQNVTSEITQITIQRRYLLKPDPVLNSLIIGALAKALELYPIQLHGFVFLSNHLHVLATFPDAKRMADFMRYFTQKLSKEVKMAHDWDAVVFPKRYRHVELSQEPGIDLARLRYIFQNSCKENLVGSPLDWPGVSSVEALVGAEPLQGKWIDRTAYRLARNRGETVSVEDFTEELQLHLTPVPSQNHLAPEEYRRLMIDMVREIEAETHQRHKVEGTAPIGVQAIMDSDPHDRSGEPETSPRPWFHTLSRAAKEAMRTALTWIVAAYREAAERLRQGDLSVEFPEGTFPPPRPFVGSVDAAGPLEPG